MSIFYRARLYMFVSKLCFCGSTLALLFLLLLLLLLLLPLLLLLLLLLQRRLLLLQQQGLLLLLLLRRRLLLLLLQLLLLNRIKRRTSCSGVPNSFIAKVLYRFVKGRTSKFHRTPVEAGVLF